MNIQQSNSYGLDRGFWYCIEKDKVLSGLFDIILILIRDKWRKWENEYRF